MALAFGLRACARYEPFRDGLFLSIVVVGFSNGMRCMPMLHNG